MVTFAIGIAVFFWFLKGQRLEKANLEESKKQLTEFKESAADLAAKPDVVAKAPEKVFAEAAPATLPMHWVKRARLFLAVFNPCSVQNKL